LRELQDNGATGEHPETLDESGKVKPAEEKPAQVLEQVGEHKAKED
jgi:hypothetical protein